MYYDGRPVDSLSINQSLENFIVFLRQQRRSVLLICHSENSYYGYALIEALIACNLVEPFRQVFHRWVDAVLLFQQRGFNAGQGNDDFSLEALYLHYRPPPFNAHDSIGRVAALSEIIEQNRDINVDPDNKFYAFTLDDLIDHVTEEDEADETDEEAAAEDTAGRA